MMTLDIPRLTDTIRANGGITYSILDGSQPASGFAVSIPGHELQLDNLTPGTLAHYIHSNAPALMSKDAYLGAWFNTDDGKWYLDTSIILSSENAACRLGAKWGQKAIFDLQSKLSLWVPQWMTYTPVERGGIAL